MNTERRIEALRLALTYVRIRTERATAIGLSTPPNARETVDIAQEFEHYISTGKPV